MSKYYRLYDNLTKKYFNWQAINPFISIREIHRRRLNSIYQHYSVNRNIEQDVNYLWQKMATSKIYPDVPEVLNIISNRYKVALLSNADHDDPLIQILVNSEFSFDAIVTSHQLELYKPSPELFYCVLDKINLNKNEVIMVGDSPISDISGAKNAGIKIIWLNRNGVQLGSHFPEPDYQISNLTQLLDLIET